jgi:hypothetical protein
MWADNETLIDLLGFDFLVDELLVILRDRRLLPVTVGVAGDWGSGKTSLIGMADEALSVAASTRPETPLRVLRFPYFRDAEAKTEFAAGLAAVIREFGCRKPAARMN